jgi:hypothetical protein
MKIQDIAFIFVIIVLLIIRKKAWLVYAGLASLILAIPLFAKWIFFTAQRLTWYAAVFFLIYILLSLFPRHTVK